AGGVLLQDVLDLVVANVRLPDWAASDLQSEIQVLSLGARGIRQLCDEYGAEVVGTAIDTLIDRSAAMLRQRIRDIPDGTYSFQDFLDNDGVSAEPLELNVDVLVRGDE